MIKISESFYTEAETAKALEVNRITIWRWIKQGRFDVQRLRGVVFIPKSQVEIIKKGGKQSGGL